MEPIYIEKTKKTPEVKFNTDGKLFLEGRSLPEYPKKFFQPLIDFVTNIEVNVASLDINLEYFNTSSSKCLMDLFKHLEANNKVENIEIIWRYENDDEDSLDSAELFEESLMRTTFKYFGYDEEE